MFNSGIIIFLTAVIKCDNKIFLANCYSIAVDSFNDMLLYSIPLPHVILGFGYSQRLLWQYSV